jgi:tetratricopeptide (TPR) repeat protein
VVLAVLPIYDLSFSRASSWTSRVPGYVAALIPCLVFLYVRSQVLAGAASTPFPFGDNPLVGASFWVSRMTAVKVIGRYLALLCWPRWLSYDYSFNENPLFSGSLTNWEDLKAVLSLLLCLAAGALAVFSYRNRKPVFFAIAFFFATLAPTSNLIIQIGSIMAERFLYLPSVGFVILAVYFGRLLAQRLASRWPEYRYAIPATAAILLIALTGRTYARNADWVDQGRFWRKGVEAAPNSYKTNLTAANNIVFLNRQDWDTAIMQVNRALAILDPVPDLQNSGTAYLHAGTFYRNLGLSMEEAQPTGQGRIDAQPWYRKSLDALLRSERIEVAQDAVTRAENAKRGKPNLTFVPSALYLQMGRTYEKLGEPQKALAAFERGRDLESDPNLLVDLAAAYRGTGDPRKAVMALMEALAVDSSRTKLLPDIGQLYSEIDPSGCAIHREGGTPIPNWDCPLVHADICTASRNVSVSYLHTGQLNEAATIRKIATQELGCAASQMQ